MKTTMCVCGSLQKTELMSPLTDHIETATTVLEATHPYAHYYGNLPQKSVPNSIFLLTDGFYYLEEIMGFGLKLETCLKNQIDLASAVLRLPEIDLPAIRVKFFPDYKNIADLQRCLQNQGVKFFKKRVSAGNYVTRVQKLFCLTEVAEGIYFDQKNRNEGYFLTDKKLPAEDFDQALRTIRNNCNCRLFDGALGEFVEDGKVQEIVRVYTEPIDLSILQVLKKEFAKLGANQQKTAVGTAV